MNEIPWLVFDYDDTLGGVIVNGKVEPTREAYTDCIERFKQYVESIGLDPEIANNVRERIDRELIAQHGFADKRRFGQSMALTYDKLREMDWNLEQSSTCYNIGMSVFTDYPYVPLDGAIDVLAEFSRHYNIAVVTKGEQAEQHRKLQETGVMSLCDAIYVANRKDSDEWFDIVFNRLEIPEETFADSWAIGNSLKADVQPLLALGFNGIHLKDAHEWSYEHADAAQAMLGRRFVTIEHISEVLDVVPRPNVKAA